jgi:CO/xanthine dehydrogenase FAD-binding subunit
MKPPVFRYLRPQSVDEALHALASADGDAKVLAGGQSLVPMLNFRMAHPGVLVDINRLSSLAGITSTAHGLTLGALTRHHAVEMSPEVAKRMPLIAAAAKHVAHVTIRNRGTFGGSLAHHDPAAEWPLVTRLFDGEITAQNTRGSRTIAAADFFRGYLTTALAEDELLTAVQLREPAPGTGWGFEEMSRRLGDFALAAVGVLWRGQQSVCAEARIALAGVGTTPLRANQAEAALRGQAPTLENFRAAAELASRDCDPPSDIHASAALRRQLVSTLVRRALVAAAARATQH